MFEFMWHLGGSIRLDSTRPDEVVLERLERLLARQRKTVNERNSATLAFDDPLWGEFGGPNWLAMVIYDRGRFWIERQHGERRLNYDLRSLHGMAVCLLFAAIAFFGGLSNGGLLGGAKYATGAFAWFYGMNILLALVRVPLAIRTAVGRD